MRIGIFDLETSGLKANFAVTLCGVVQPVGGKRKVFRIDELDGKIGSCDKELVGALVEELNSYTILIAHNGVFFDRKFLNSRAIKWGLNVLDPHKKMYDPVQVARQKMAISWNGLENLANFLGCKHKKYETVGDLWVRATLDHDKDAFEEIVKHCVADVAVLDEVASRLEPLIGQINHWGSG